MADNRSAGRRDDVAALVQPDFQRPCVFVDGNVVISSRSTDASQADMPPTIALTSKHLPAVCPLWAKPDLKGTGVWVNPAVISFAITVNVCKDDIITVCANPYGSRCAVIVSCGHRDGERQ